MNVAVWNNGVAFRYELTGADTKNVTAEASSFVLPTNSTPYYQPDTSVYEGSFAGANVGALAANTMPGSPVTVKLPGTTGYLV